MSGLAIKIKKAIRDNRSIFLDEDDGSSHHLTVSGSTVKIIEGKGSEYIEVTSGSSTILYNLNKAKSIKIS